MLGADRKEPSMTLSAIAVRELSSQHTAVVRQRISMQETNRIPGWIGETMEAVQRAGQQPAGMPFVRMLSMDTDSMEVEVGWPVAAPFSGDGEVLAGSLPGGPAAVASYYGPYEGIGPAYEEMQAWCKDQGRESSGPPWESYFTDPNTEPDQSKWRTDIHFPLRA
jgi:effector-binding domain-containing protein